MNCELVFLFFFFFQLETYLTMLCVCVLQWHALTREEQAKYYELARKERQLHMQLYPSWSARDNYVSAVRHTQIYTDIGRQTDTLPRISTKAMVQSIQNCMQCQKVIMSFMSL